MKKKILECPIHGLALHRCKRQNWKGAPGKSFASEYTEKCFKCISEGRIKSKVIQPRKRSRTVSLRE